MTAEPAPTPVTTPLAFTEATALLLLLHVPPATDPLKVILELTQTIEAPLTEGAPGQAVVLKVISLP